MGPAALYCSFGKVATMTAPMTKTTAAAITSVSWARGLARLVLIPANSKTTANMIV